MIRVNGKAGKIEVRLASWLPGRYAHPNGTRIPYQLTVCLEDATRCLTNTTLLPLLSYSRRRVKGGRRG
jgi:hypothetical protein